LAKVLPVNAAMTELAESTLYHLVAKQPPLLVYLTIYVYMLCTSTIYW